jgi:hypothetical protein
MILRSAPTVIAGNSEAGYLGDLASVADYHFVAADGLECAVAVDVGLDRDERSLGGG